MGFYDNLDNNVKTLPERCREYYKPEEFVVVMNIDTEPFTYVIQRPENVLINNPSAMTKELYYLKDPDVITLTVGQTRLVPAYEADIVIKQMIDKIVLRNRGAMIAEGVVPKESAMDPVTQHKYIQQIFQGKRDFMSEYNQQMNQVEQVNTQARALAASDLADKPNDLIPAPGTGANYEPATTTQGSGIQSVIQAAQA